MKIINEFCLVKDQKIECVLIKSENKTSLSPLVLLHEGLGSIEMWKDWPTKLALKTKMNLVLYSRIGMGKSSEEKIKKKLTFLKMRHCIICLK